MNRMTLVLVAMTVAVSAAAQTNERGKPTKEQRADPACQFTVDQRGTKFAIDEKGVKREASPALQKRCAEAAAKSDATPAVNKAANEAAKTSAPAKPTGY